MSTEKKLPPIQPAPVKPFTLRLVNGHFVRIPKVEIIAVTAATRPSATARTGSFPYGDGESLPCGLRLVDGRFVNGPEESAPLQIPSDPTPAVASPTSALPQPRVPTELSPDSRV